MKRTLQLSMMLLVLLQLVACGLGTEVGNGAKPNDGDERSGGQKSAKDDANDENTAAPSPEAEKEDGAEGDDGADPQGTAGVAVPEAPEGFDFSPSLLVAPCASPFAEDFGSNYNLGTADSGEGVRNVLHATREGAQGPWSIKDGSDALLYKVEKNAAGGALAVTTKDAEDKAVDYGYTCTGVTTKTNVDVEDLAFKVTKKSLYLGNASLKVMITWYFKAATEAAKAELVRIEVDDADGENDPVRLDATAVPVP